MVGLAQRALDAATPLVLPHYPAQVLVSRAVQADLVRVSSEAAAARALTFATVRLNWMGAMDWDTNEFIAQAGMAELVARRAAEGAARRAAASGQRS